MAKKGKKRADIPARPTVSDEQVVQNGIIAFCRVFQKYDAAQLLEVYSSTESDGYGLARALEAYGIHPSEETVTELSQLESHIHDALIVAEKAWVRNNDVRLHIQEGQQVTFPLRNGDSAGVVVGTDPTRAIYYVRRDGDTDPSHKYYVFAERVRVVVDICSEGSHKAWPCPACGLGPCLHEAVTSWQSPTTTK